MIVIMACIIIVVLVMTPIIRRRRIKLATRNNVNRNYFNRLNIATNIMIITLEI